MAKRKKMDREEEQHLPGMAPERNEKVHRAAKVYAKLRDARMAANEDEKAAHDRLLEVMLQEGLESYTYGDVTITVDLHRKAKVKIEATGTSKGEAAGDAKKEE